MHFPYPLETAYNSIYRKKFLDLSLFTPWKLCKIVSHSLEVPRPKTKRPLWNFHMFILQYPWNSINDIVMIIFLQYTILFGIFSGIILKSSWIGVRTLSLLLKVTSRKLELWFVLWSFFLLRVLCITINLPSYGHA